MNRRNPSPGRFDTAKKYVVICAVVRAAIADPIGSITQISSDEPVPGAVPYRATEISKTGTHQVICYKRTDLVSVHIGYREKGKGGDFTVQKIAGTWKIIHKGYWIR